MTTTCLIAAWGVIAWGAGFSDGSGVDPQPASKSAAEVDAAMNLRYILASKDVGDSSLLWAACAGANISLG
jgi:hypothetical protein